MEKLLIMDNIYEYAFAIGTTIYVFASIFLAWLFNKRADELHRREQGKG
jgi:hypothetical protein